MSKKVFTEHSFTIDDTQFSFSLYIYGTEKISHIFDIRKLNYKEYSEKNSEKIKERSKLYYLKNKEKINEQNNNNYQKNKDRDLLKHKEWRENNPNYSKKYYQNHKEEILLQKEKYYNDNKEYILQMCKEYYFDNREKILQRDKIYRELHPEICKKYYQDHKKESHQWVKEYYKNHPEKRKIKDLKRYARLKGWGNPEPINDWFEGSHFHHLHVDGNHSVGIYIPSELHKSISHSYNNKESMQKINDIAIRWYQG